MWRQLTILTSFLVLLIFGPGRVHAQAQAEPLTARDIRAFERVEELSEHLQFSASDPRKEQLYAELDSQTGKLIAELDGYIEQAFTLEEGADSIEARLRAVLALHVPDSESGDLPLVHLVETPTGPGLILAYTIVRGAHHDLATVRGYRWDGERFRLAADAGEDFEGYGMFKAILPSPISGEVWLLAWGRAQAFNGNRVRVRVYTFDGDAIRSVWEPDDVFSANVWTTEHGFVVEHELRTPPQYQRVRDEYGLDVNGPVKTN